MFAILMRKDVNIAAASELVRNTVSGCPATNKIPSLQRASLFIYPDCYYLFGCLFFFFFFFVIDCFITVFNISFILFMPLSLPTHLCLHPASRAFLLLARFGVLEKGSA